ncbi:prelamin-A/C-like [Acanthochromis polyacanthus]|uniref:prelamin-A/C-like n=1 Tax=Acanthochromis polyacanthus TaxID=80966 RepID=UPI00223486FD|nr:prelamin-A/C-like [Acanthochromis polyacanthus]
MEKEHVDTKKHLQQEKDEKKKAENEVATLKNELEKLKRNNSETNNQLQQETKENETLKKHLEENEKKLMETESELRTEGNKLEISRKNSASGRSTTPPITVEEVHQNGLYIRLKNISTEEIKLGGWKLELLKNDRETDTYAFKEPLKLHAGGILCISSQRYSSTPYGDVRLLWSKMMKWSPEDKLKINLIRNKEEMFRLL